MFFESFVFDADENLLLGSATGEIAVGSAVAGAGETDGLFAINSVGGVGFKDCIGVEIVCDIFVKGDSDAAENINDGAEGAPVKVGVILEIYI